MQQKLGLHFHVPIFQKCLERGQEGEILQTKPFCFQQRPKKTQMNLLFIAEFFSSLNQTLNSTSIYIHT